MIWSFVSFSEVSRSGKPDDGDVTVAIVVADTAVLGAVVVTKLRSEST